MEFIFKPVQTGKKTSNVDLRPSLRVLSSNGRMKVSDKLKSKLGLEDHLSFGLAPVKDEDGNVFVGIFKSVGIQGEDGIEYPMSAKISKTNELTDSNISSNLRELVISELTGDEKETAKDRHFVFLPAKNEADEEIWGEAEIEGESVRILVMQYEESELKARNTDND